MSGDQKERGRPLDISKNKLILDATLELLGSKGFDQLKIENIANLAKVSKATIYRRWNSKEALVLEAVKSVNPFESLNQLPGLNDETKSIRDHLITILTYCFVENRGINIHVMTALYAAFPHDKEYDHVLLDQFSSQLTNTLLEVIPNKFILENDQIVELITNVTPALVIYQIILMKKKISTEFIENVVDVFLLPAIYSVNN